MAVVVRLCPSVCASSHFAVLLGAYGASLSILGECGDGGWDAGGCGDRGWDPGGSGDQGVGRGAVRQGAVTQESVGTRGGTWWCGTGRCDSGECRDRGMGPRNVGTECCDLGPQGPGGVASGYGHLLLLPEVFVRPRGEPPGGFVN